MLNPFPVGFYEQSIPDKLLHLSGKIDDTGNSFVQLGNSNIQTSPEATLFGGGGFVYYSNTDFVRVMARDEFHPSQHSWTVDMWFFNPGGIPGTCYFFTFTDPTNNNYNWTEFRQDGGNLQFKLYRFGSNVGTAEAPASIPAGWVHIAATFDSESGEYAAFLNGTEVLRDTIDAEGGYYPVYKPDIIIGNDASYQEGSATQPQQAPWSFPTPSVIKAFRVTKSVLWDTAFTPPTPPYTLTDDTQVMIYGYGDVANRHSVFTTTYASSRYYGGIGLNPTAGPFGPALSFNRSWQGLNWYDSIHTEASDDFSFDDTFAVECWMLTKYFAYSGYVWNILGSNVGLYLSGSTPRCYVNGSYFTINCPTLYEGEWNHFLITRDGNDDVRAAVDGTFVTNKLNYAGTLGGNANFVLNAAGPNATTENRNQYIDELVVWPTNVYSGDFTPRDRPW